MKLQNDLRFMQFLPAVLFVIKLETGVIFATEEKSPVFREGNESLVSDEFDRPLSLDDNFKTFAPEGPSTNTLNKATITSILISPGGHGRLSTTGSKHKTARPGSKSHHTIHHNQDRREAKHADDHHSLKTCQYVFTVENAADCTHTKTEIAVSHVTHTVLQGSETILDEYSHRLRKLEHAVYGFTEEPNEMQADGAVVQVETQNIESDSTISTAYVEEEVPKNLIEIAQEMIKQLSMLERGIVRSEKEREVLRSRNENLISTLRKSVNARKKLVALRSDLERSLRRMREENAKLCASNRTLTVENAALKSYKYNVETTLESLRKRIRTLETEQSLNSRDGCRQQNINIIDENNALKQRVSNLTDAFDMCKKISTEDESWQLKFVKEQEKNTMLAADNLRLTEALENATLKIKELMEEKQRAVFSSEEDDDTTGWTPSSRRMDDQDYSYCGKISSISNPETIRGAQSYLEKSGVWMMDPLQAVGEGKVWSIDTTKERIKEMKQFGSIQNFVRNKQEDDINLPVPVENTGAVIYNGSLYYQRRNSRKLVRYDLQAKRILKERAVPRAGFHGVFAYQWGGHTDIDLAVDELGLWVIYSTRRNDGNIVISKLDPSTLKITTTIKTTIPKRSVANAFMVCGIMYTVDSYDSPKASLNFEFDTFTRTKRRISIPFANQHRYNVMIDYNPQLREIFSWDNSHQVRYFVTLDKTKGKTAQLVGSRRSRRAKGGK